MDIEKLLDNAACCSQDRTLLDDGTTRECVRLNVVDPLMKEIERLIKDNQWAGQELTKAELEIERLKAKMERFRDQHEKDYTEIERLRAALAKSCKEGRGEMYDCGYNRLWAALERYADPEFWPEQLRHHDYLRKPAIDALNSESKNNRGGNTP